LAGSCGLVNEANDPSGFFFDSYRTNTRG
jgi:hypothetical protein